MSIPKIIHYCWFGGGPISPESRKCIESWKKYCPDYKIIEWNEQNFEISQNRYAQQAYEAKKYAFVSDYVRLAVLYRYGGIYLDTDVELVRPLDELLEHKGFISMEHSAPSPYGRTLLVNTGSGVGAEPGCEMIGKMLAAYRNAAFIQETGEPDLRTCTQRDTPLFTKAGLQQKDEQQELDGFLVLPFYYHKQKQWCGNPPDNAQNIKSKAKTASIRARLCFPLYFISTSPDIPAGAHGGSTPPSRPYPTGKH